ncbi:MAG TPA: zf-HC2 domain-containing protein [Polyangiaceae bacterium]|jgi:hypothetical protein
MDCEKFETAMMDELYGELDELTSAAAKRHVAGCARCAALIGGLRATRRVATVPLVEVPDGLEERILDAARAAQKVVPLRRRVARAISLAGSWAMRPQTAMAAVFLVMIGTSVLLLRGKSARAPVSAEVTVTEKGAPAFEPTAGASASPLSTLDQPTAPPMASALAAAHGNEPKPAATATIPIAPDVPGEDLRAKGLAKAQAAPKDDDALNGIANASTPAGAPPQTLPPAPPGVMGGGGQAGPGRAYATPPPPAVAQAEKKSPDTPFDTALQSYRAGRFDDATRAFDALGDVNAALWAARAVREDKGCRNAVARFDKVAQRGAGSPPGWDALLEGALCYRAIGDFSNARVRLNALLGVDSHKDRARAELDRLNQLQQAQGSSAPPSGAARPSPRKAAAPQATQAPSQAPPATDSAY